MVKLGPVFVFVPPAVTLSTTAGLRAGSVVLPTAPLAVNGTGFALTGKYGNIEWGPGKSYIADTRQSLGIRNEKNEWGGHVHVRQWGD